MVAEQQQSSVVLVAVVAALEEANLYWVRLDTTLTLDDIDSDAVMMEGRAHLDAEGAAVAANIFAPDNTPNIPGLGVTGGERALGMLASIAAPIKEAEATSKGCKPKRKGPGQETINAMQLNKYRTV